jgi:integrase
MIKQKRAKRGMGHLFKMHLGKQHPADWKGAGAFWINFSPGKGCGRIVQALTDADGKAITDRAQAEQARMKLVGAGLAGDRVEALRGVLTAKLATAKTDLQAARLASVPGVKIADAWDTYERLPKNMRPDSGDTTLEQYAFQWGRFSRWIGENHPEAVTLRDVTEDHAAAYAADLEASGMSGATINKHFALLRLVFRFIRKQAGITADPWGDIRPAKHRAKGRRELTTVELRRVCDEASGELRVMLAAGLYTGMRLADCALLRWDEIDFAQGVIMATPKKTERTSGKQVRIPLHASLREILQALPRKAEYVLPETAIDYQARRDYVTDKIQRHFRACGIDVHSPGTGGQIERDGAGAPVRDDAGRVRIVDTGKRAVVAVGFHSLRHSFVSMCRAAGVPLSVVESLVGHSNPNTTRLYSHTGDGAAEQAIAGIPSFTGALALPMPGARVAGVLGVLPGLSESELKSVITRARELLKKGAA